MKNILLGTAGAMILTFTAAADATIVSASSGAAYLSTDSECFSRDLYGRVTRGGGDDCFDDGDPFPDAYYWTIDLWSSNTAQVSKSFSVFGSSGTQCSVGDCTTVCAAIVVNTSGGLVSWTGQHALTAGGFWRGLTPSLNIAGPDVNTSQVECFMGSGAGNWVSAVKVNGTL